MTREEIKNTPEIVDYLLAESVIADTREKLHKRMEVICNLAIKALEQEPILDKIRAEIKAMSGDIETIADVLATIDKYKAESEGE